jgi:NADPH:quinone reductase-like Zn-dependent oxidoreductase/acyl carrier protein
VPATAQSLLSPSLRAFAAAANRRAAGETLAGLLERNDRLFPPARALRVLRLGGAAPDGWLNRLAGAGRVHLTVFQTDHQRLDGFGSAIAHTANTQVVGADRIGEAGAYDLIVAETGLSDLPAGVTLDRLRRGLATNGLLIAVAPPSSLFDDLVFGLDHDWFAGTGRRQTATEWLSALETAGFTNCEAAAIRCGDSPGMLLLAEAPRVAAAVAAAPSKPQDRNPPIALRLPAKGWLGRVGAEFVRLLDAAGCGTEVAIGDAAPSFAIDGQTVVQFLPAPDAAASLVDELTATCLRLKAVAEALAGSNARLWLVFGGSLPGDGAAVCPQARAAWAFSRVLANEFASLDIRRIDIEPGMTPDQAAARLRDIVLSTTSETELHIGGRSLGAVRVGTLSPSADDSNAEAARLQVQGATGRVLQWQPAVRSSPDADEIEIAVEATGLNFRDVMGMLSLLPDDILEDGFAGPLLGLECAGYVTRVGPAVAGFRPGDRVVALAAGAFATHATVPAGQAVRLPGSLSFAAAATIPVAFLTAYYALVARAGLKRGEWVLIHGGAGGVGMAAIQIARRRGARIIATAGSSAKRALLRALGVPHVLDSRSTEFVDAVQRITGSGVAVVLNSLAGEAMEQSLACLAPFGRFVELGKRDYVANTHLGLRPFHKNLSYFGVDLDQLVGSGDTVRKIFAEVMRRFVTGSLTPLPYTIFDAARVADAFHLMQQSAHIGKIVVRPPRPGAVRKARLLFKPSASGTHLLTGAFGGFGLETAKWLVDNGARHLVLVGRSGASTPQAAAAVAEMRARGAEIFVAPCDVADEAALAALLDTIGAAMPPLVGAIHLAMVLDDAIVANLDAERLRSVLLPKVRGADNLDRLTRHLALDYFILFSSVTTLIGNPGQGNYVAANAYMEGLARRRRKQGLPALAIGWGPIADVGVVARNALLRAGLEKLAGAKGMKAREALDLMGEALALAANSEHAVITIAPNDGSFGGDRLPVLRSPTYDALLAALVVPAGDAAIDLKSLLASDDEAAIRGKVGDVVAAQVARVLHFRHEDLSRTRPLAELGLDSLMALELAMNLETALGVQIAAAGAADALTIAALTDQIIAQASMESRPPVASVVPIAQRHAAAVAPTELEVLTELMEPRSKTG